MIAVNIFLTQPRYVHLENRTCGVCVCVMCVFKGSLNRSEHNFWYNLRLKEVKESAMGKSVRKQHDRITLQRVTVVVKQIPFGGELVIFSFCSPDVN